MKGEDQLLHVYGQAQWHDSVQIVGESSALEALRDALTRSLERHSGYGTAKAFANDGEGYHIEIYLADADEMETLPTPYHDRIASTTSQSDWQRLAIRLGMKRNEARADKGGY